MFFFRAFLKRALEEFKMTAGNFYLNDKSTGSVVGMRSICLVPTEPYLKIKNIYSPVR